MPPLSHFQDTTALMRALNDEHIWVEIERHDRGEPHVVVLEGRVTDRPGDDAPDRYRVVRRWHTMEPVIWLSDRRSAYIVFEANARTLDRRLDHRQRQESYRQLTALPGFGRFA